MRANSIRSRGGLTAGKTGLVSQAAALVGFLAVSFAVSALSSVAIVSNAPGWYAAASKAPWTPPGWVFGSVWTTLYATMAVAAWLVWRQRSAPTRGAMSAYAVQMLLNLAWAPTFFGMYPIWGVAALWLGLVVIAALVAAVATTIVRFGLISTTAGLLMLPCLSWVVFSGSLNLYAAVNN